MSATDSLAIALGAVLLVAVLYDVFQSIVLPRPAVGRVRLSVTFVRRAWRAWRFMATRPRSLRTREAALAVFGPLIVVVLLVVWGFVLILAFALLYFGLRDQLHPQPETFGQTVYFSAGRMLAFPAGGIEPTGAAARVMTAFEAATGFGLFALVISLLFSLFSAFQRREAAVVSLDVFAGAPPSGVQLLETCAKEGLPDQLVRTFEDWRAWTADVLESHLAYPTLFYFRSSHDNEAWLNSFGAMMDASTLVLTTIEGGPAGHARLFHKMAMHFVQDVRVFTGYRLEAVPGVEREEFLEACGRLERAGYRLRDLDAAWDEFSAIRTKYGPWLNQITKNLAFPPAPWIGDRSYVPHRDRGAVARPLGGDQPGIRPAR